MSVGIFGTKKGSFVFFSLHKECRCNNAIIKIPLAFQFVNRLTTEMKHMKYYSTQFYLDVKLSVSLNSHYILPCVKFIVQVNSKSRKWRRKEWKKLNKVHIKEQIVSCGNVCCVCSVAWLKQGIRSWVLSPTLSLAVNLTRGWISHILTFSFLRFLFLPWYKTYAHIKCFAVYRQISSNCRRTD